MQSTNPAGSGGFLQSLPSPSPSTTSSHRSTPNLPHPRSHPLHAGSKKEDTARRYVENRLLQISRRFVKKFSVLPGEEDTEKADVRGYANFNEVAKDLDEVVDVLWLSGTPSLQIPYMLQIAVTLTSYLPSFPPAPSSTFSLLKKLDHAFASLIIGRDKISGDLLPGLENGPGNGFSRTELIRLRSVVTDARLRVAEVLTGAAHDAVEVESDSDGENEGMELDVDEDDDADDGSVEMGIAKTYDTTIVQLNLVLGDNIFTTAST